MWLLTLLCLFSLQNFVASSFDMGGIISGNRMAAVPLGASLGAGELDVEGICVRAGVTCQNCSHAITCVLLPVGWLKVPLETCAGGQTCNAYLGGCSNQSVPECDVTSKKYQHSCEQVGIFPDAFDCRKFHLCSPPEGLPNGRPADHRAALCPRHYAYNPQTAQCSVKLPNGQCTEKPVPDCTRIGQSGVLINSANHYYVCLSKHGALYPQVFICPHGWLYSEGYCHEKIPQPEVINVTTKKPEMTTRLTTDSSSSSPENKNIVTSSASWISNLFTTEKPITNTPDTFLADKFPNLANYDDTNNDVANNNYDLFSSSSGENDW